MRYPPQATPEQQLAELTCEVSDMLQITPWNEQLKYIKTRLLLIQGRRRIPAIVRRGGEKH